MTSKDTDLYKLYDANIFEKIAEQKKREAERQIIAGKLFVDRGQNRLT